MRAATSTEEVCVFWAIGGEFPDPMWAAQRSRFDIWADILFSIIGINRSVIVVLFNSTL